MTGGPRRTVVTGVGVVAPGGANRREFWQLLTSGRTATGDSPSGWGGAGRLVRLFVTEPDARVNTSCGGR